MPNSPNSSESPELDNWQTEPFHAALRDVFEEWKRAKAKHGEMTPDGNAADHIHNLATLIEEVGEVGRCFTYDRDHAGNLRKELIQTAAMAVAWASVLPREGEG